MLRLRWSGLALGLLLLAPSAGEGQQKNKLPAKAPKIGMAPNPNGGQPAANNNGIVAAPNGFNLNNNGAAGFNINQLTGGNLGAGGPAFANSQLSNLYQAASPFNSPFSNPFATPFNNPYPIVNNPFTNGNLRNGLPYGGYNPFYQPMNNVHLANPWAYPAYNSAAMNPYANPYMNPYANPYMNPYMNPYLPGMSDPLANPFLPAQFYQNLLQNPNPFNQFNQ